MSESSPAPDSSNAAGGGQPAVASPPRIWPGVLIVGLYWVGVILIKALDLVISSTFVLTVGVGLLATLAFLIWWLSNRSYSWADRLLGCGVAVAGGIVTSMVTQHTLGAAGSLFFGLPLLLTVWIAWLVISRRLTPTVRRYGLVCSLWLAWALLCVVRVDGVDGDMWVAFHWRWTPTEEEQYLAERTNLKAGDALAGAPLTLVAGDWPAFRGANDLGEQEHAAIVTDWTRSPPKQLWKRRVGPAWSSFVVIGDRLFTQEQRGEDEATVCLDATTGQEIWTHLDHTRFWDGQAGAGPRGTPTFVDGKLYTYGATGVLNALDAATGKALWTRDVVKETGAPLPMWGFSSSPLVVDDVVIVFAGGKAEHGLVAYKIATGEPAWHAATGPVSYSSAQLVTLDGVRQALLLSDLGLAAVDPLSGKLLWNYEANGRGIWRAAQPRPLGDSQVLFGSEDLGLRLLEVKQAAEKWAVKDLWTTNALRPAYNDFVVVDDVAYGFDKQLFAAIDLKTGKRLWKGGRYGYGQVLLLRPQNLLLVLGEQGEVALLKANPGKHEELSRFQAIEGKTWNHPVVAHNRLYVRNDTEMAAFELQPATE